MMDFLKKIWGYVLQFVAWVRYRTKRKYKRVYEVYNSDALEHIGLHLRGLPIAGTKIIVKGGTSDTVPRHYEVQILNVFKLSKEQKDRVEIPSNIDAYYIDGRYNDLEIKRIS